MGTIHFDQLVVEFDDRLLTHLQIVMVQRFRTDRPVLLSWLDPVTIGDGRSSTWIHPTAIVHFKFSGSRTPDIDTAWLAMLGERADSGPGLVVCDSTGRSVHAGSGTHLHPRR